MPRLFSDWRLNEPQETRPIALVTDSGGTLRSRRIKHKYILARTDSIPECEIPGNIEVCLWSSYSELGVLTASALR